MMIKLREPTIKISADTLISLSLFMIVFLYNIPITMMMPGFLRKPLLILSAVMCFAGIAIKNIKHALGCGVIIGMFSIFYMLSWSENVGFASYIFPAVISAEVFVCTLLALDGGLKIPKSFLWFCIIVTLITAVTTILGLMQYPQATRMLAGTGVDLYRYMNIAGWGLMFGMAFFEGVMLHMYIKTKNMLLLPVLAINGICVVMSQLMFAVLLMGLVVVAVLINGKQHGMVLRTGIIAIVVIMVWVFRAEILMAFYSLFVDMGLSVMALRTKNIYDMLVLSNSRGNVGVRMELYMMSLRSFLNYPLGRFFASRNTIASDIGFHSEFCDVLGVLGIWGAALIAGAFGSIVVRVRNIAAAYDRRFYVIMLGGFSALFLINPVIANPQMWMSPLLMPLVAIAACAHEEKE